MNLEKEVIHPERYGGKDYVFEPIKVIEAWKLNFCLGNVVKYIGRLGKKDTELLELKKAKFYLDREIETREKNM